MITFIILLMISDTQKLIDAIYFFEVRYLPYIILAMPVNYIMRFIKFNYYLDLIGVQAKTSDKIIANLSSMCMTITPAKIGELIKCYLIKEKYDTAMSMTVPLVMAERLTDGIAMIVLAAVGYGGTLYGLPAMIAVFFVLMGFVLIVQSKPLCKRVLYYLGKIPSFSKHIEKINNFYHSISIALQIKPLVIAIGLGLITWSCESFIVWASVRALGGTILFKQALFVFSFSAIAGSISMMPGGVLVADGTIAGILILIGIDYTTASAVTIISRFSSLWLGEIVGFFALVIAERKGMLWKKT